MQIPLLGRLRSTLAEAREEIAARRTAARLRDALVSRPLEPAPEAVVDFLFSREAEAIQPWQFQEEFLALARLVHSRRPRTVLEIGTADGGTLFAHARLAASDALVISIDLPKGAFGGGYPAWRKSLYESFAGPGQRIELLQADSHSPATADALETILAGRRIDYAFIDGDHTLEGVRQDFELCRRFAATNGVIALHDVVEHPPSTGCEVHDFWTEVRDSYRHDEFILDPAQECYGIGVIHLGET